jgi:hypothetical protein
LNDHFGGIDLAAHFGYEPGYYLPGAKGQETIVALMQESQAM